MTLTKISDFLGKKAYQGKVENEKKKIINIISIFTGILNVRI
jgi:hypothetical protein